MSYDLILKNFVNTEPSLMPSEIIEFSFKQKKSGEQVGIVKTLSRVTYIKRITSDGLDITSVIKIPFFSSIEERNGFIVKNLKNYTQEDIAIFLNLSQSQVSNIIRNYNKK